MTNVHQITQNDVQTEWPDLLGHDTPAKSVTPRSRLARLADKLKTAIESRVPLGHQDEAGFHHGKKIEKD